MYAMRSTIAELLTLCCILLGRPTILCAETDSAKSIVMKAGVAKAVITPENWKELTTVMGTKPTHKDHDLFARALTLSDEHSRLVIVTYDLNCLDVATPILRKRCQAELKLPPSHLILLGTHNHAAPIQIVPANFAYGRWLADRLFDLISRSIDQEQGPVQVSIGHGNGYFIRTTGNAPADYEIQLLKVSRGDQTLALLFNHPTHPLQSSQTRIDVGHPGYAVDFIEQAVPAATAMFADACGGNQFPDRGSIMYGTAKQVEELGKELGEATLKIAKGEMTDISGPISSRLEIISLPLAEPLSYEAAKKIADRDKVPLNIGLVPYPHPDRKSNWIRALLKHHEEKIPFPKRTTDRVCTDDGFLVQRLGDDREYPCRYEEVIVATIGPLCFVAMQGEVCAPIGMRIKDGLRRKKPLFVCSYMGEHNLYIPTRELVRLDAYQAQVIRTQYASPVGWAPEVEDEMVQGVLKIVTQATGTEPLKLTR
jgi:neutral ceramidase